VIEYTPELKRFDRFVHQQVTKLPDMLFQFIGVVGGDHQDRRWL
jgi:hypothetical protein